MRRKDRLRFVTAWVVGIFIGACGLAGQTMGGTDSTYKTFGAPWADTVFYVIRDRDDGSLIDSSMFDTAAGVGFASFPYETLYTWDNTKNYSTKEYWYFPGDGWVGWNTDVILTFSSSPTPTYLVSWYIIDSANSVVVPGAKVVSKNWDLSATLASPTSDANGIALTSVDSDSIATIVTANKYIFPTKYDSIKFTTDTSDTIFGYLNVPAAAPGVHSVTIYLDVTSTIVDSTTGTPVARDRILFTLVPHFVPGSTDGNYLIAPKVQEKRPNSSGRVTFTVMANSPVTPDGSYYSLSWTAKDGRSSFRGSYPNIIVDTLVDPVNILDLTQTD